ncbi:MAG: nucleotidyltransferase [Deltaproteobacteria bacterium]|nr:nucleotidyltransferase [Deltaproteobacteria bacterium]
MTNFGALIRRLSSAGVEFVLIGGVAVLVHGHVRATLDLDVCYARTPENLERLVAALGPIHPRLRGAPEGLPFFFDVQTLRNGLNFTLVTDDGDLDLLGEVTGVGGYADLALQAVSTEVYGFSVKLISLDDLIRAKAAAGRPKDLLDLEALRALKPR